MFYINERWSNNFTVVPKHCDQNLELLVISTRPFYMPREFNNIFVINVYMPPVADYKCAAEVLHNCILDCEKKSPDAVKIIVGDFNKCNFQKFIPHCKQFVTCPTRI